MSTEVQMFITSLGMTAVGAALIDLTPLKVFGWVVLVVGALLFFGVVKSKSEDLKAEEACEKFEIEK